MVKIIFFSPPGSDLIPEGSEGALPLTILPVKAMRVCAVPKGRVFVPFWSERGYRLFARFGLESGMIFKDSK